MDGWLVGWIMPGRWGIDRVEMWGIWDREREFLMVGWDGRWRERGR